MIYCCFFFVKIPKKNSVMGNQLNSLNITFICSTFSEAVDVGNKMMAKHIILTHFSQRYPHMVPLFGITLPENVGLAFDNMQARALFFYCTLS